MATRLERAFYARDSLVVARELLGKILVRQRAGRQLRGRIVETEAYQGLKDAASHAYRGQTARNTPMFGEGGHAYVYLIYGMWNCMNVVTGAPGVASAVLLRALDFAGLDQAFHARDGAGPGKLCVALAIDRTLTGTDLVAGDALWLEDDGVAPKRGQLARGPRIGVDYAGAWALKPWRFWWKGNHAVSRK